MRIHESGWFCKRPHCPAVVDAAEREGRIRPGGTLVEAAGNTGVGLALVCARRGYQLVCVMPEKMSEDKRQALRALGAEVIVTDNAPPGDPKNFQRCSNNRRESPVFWTNQLPTEPIRRFMKQRTRLWEQTKGEIGAFIAGVGTGGTITGVGRYLKSQNPNVRIVLADPKGSRLAGLINHGELGEDGRIWSRYWPSQVAPVFDPNIVDEAVTIDDATSFEMASRLARKKAF